MRAQVGDRAGRRWGRKQRKRKAIEAMASFASNIAGTDHERKMRWTCERLDKVMGPRPWVAEGEAAVWGKGSPTGTEQGDRS